MDLSTPITRRTLLRGGAAAGFSVGAARLGLLSGAAGSLWLDGPAHAETAAGSRLVVIFLRGGADGLHLLAPTGDPHYVALRGPLALNGGIPIARSVENDAKRDAVRFRLHPAFEPVADLVGRDAGGGRLGGATARATRLAAIPMAGSPDGTRSHFEAQDRMESGLAGRQASQPGWLARALGAAASADADPFALLALGANLPLTLRGGGGFAIDDPARFGLPRASGPARRALLAAYRDETDGPVAQAGARALEALASYERKVGGERRSGRRERRGGASLEASARELYQLVSAGFSVRAAFIEGDGWDSHRGQGADAGGIARRVEDLARTLAMLARPASDGRPSLVVVMTEFGRTVRANGSGGSDHGHGCTMLVLGPGVRAGVHGHWTGLDPAGLYEGRDLPVHSDFRSVLGEVLTAHLGSPPPADTFPGFAAGQIGLFG